MRGGGVNPASLTALAIDLILCILKDLRPADIISLRKTCKALHELTRLRMVWTSALRSIMAQHSLPEATCPIHEMPLSLLEHVALAPHRFLSLLLRSGDAKIQPLTARVLVPRLTDAEKAKYTIMDNDGLYDSYMEHSGRYLASLSAYQSFTLFSIWDLGLCSNDVIKPVARFLEPAPLTLFLDGFFPDPAEANNFYLVSTHESSFVNPLSIFIHKASLAPPGQISFLAKLEIPVAAPFIIPHTSQLPGTNKLVAQYDDDDGIKHFWVWDFIDNTVAAFMAVDYQSSGRETSLYHDDCVMIASDGRIRIYNVPPLLPRSSIVVPIEQKATIIIAAPRKASTSFFTIHDNEGKMPCRFFEITPAQVTAFEVTENNQLQSSNLPNKLPIALGSVSVTSPSFWSSNQRFIGPKRCEDFLLLPGYGSGEEESGDLLIFAVDMRKVLEGIESTQLTKTTLSMRLNRQTLKGRRLFPLLGRMYVHARQRAADLRVTHCIYILDYLAPPNRV